MKRLIAFMLALVMSLSLCACGGSDAPAPTEVPTEASTEAPAPTEPTIDQEELERQAAYHEKMAAGLGNVAPEQITDFKAVALVEQKGGESRYVDTYIDPYWAAQEPEDVRYIVKCSLGASNVGWYTLGGIAYKHVAEVQIIDLVTGLTRAEKVFRGGEPPETVQDKGDHYGSEVDPAEIREWTASVIDAEVAEFAENALKKIKERIDKIAEYPFSADSRSEMMAELQKYYDFSDEILQYALDHCGANWNEHARIKGEWLLQRSEWGYSPDYFAERLTDGYGFTIEQAAYAAQSVDWNEQALKCAETSVYVSTWTKREEVITYLTGEGFTREQAAYAAEKIIP